MDAPSLSFGSHSALPESLYAMVPRDRDKSMARSGFRWNECGQTELHSGPDYNHWTLESA